MLVGFHVRLLSFHSRESMLSRVSMRNLHHQVALSDRIALVHEHPLDLARHR
jgi:hypothetical protein